jgi:hypothetical protein
MKEYESAQFSTIEKAIQSPKVEILLKWHYWSDSRHENFNPTVPNIGIIVTFNSGDFDLKDILSRGVQGAALYTSYSEIPPLVDNPNVQTIEMCDKNILELLQSADSEVIELTTPWSGPHGDEWDSSAYHDFWGNAEKYFNEKVRTLEKIGKVVKIA